MFDSARSLLCFSSLSDRWGKVKLIQHFKWKCTVLKSVFLYRSCIAMLEAQRSIFHSPQASVWLWWLLKKCPVGTQPLAKDYRSEGRNVTNSKFIQAIKIVTSWIIFYILPIYLCCVFKLCDNFSSWLCFFFQEIVCLGQEIGSVSEIRWCSLHTKLYW